MTTVPSNLVPTRISQLPEYAGSSTEGYLPYVLNGITYKVQFANIAAVGAVPSTRTVTGGDGLAGGGDLSTNRVIYLADGGVTYNKLADSGVVAGTYGSSSLVPVLTVDAKGRVTTATTTAINLSNYVPTSRAVLAGSGLTGGGTLDANRTISLILSTATPQSGGTPASGTSTTAAREDHVHPAVNLTNSAETSGVLPMSRGGTGSSLSPAAGAILYSTGSETALTGAGSAGQVLTSTGGGMPVWSSAGAGSGTVTSVSGTGSVNGITLSGTVTTSGSLTLGGTLTGIANSQLNNSSITINGTPVSLGGSILVSSALVTQDEGVTLTSSTSSFNFTGAGVTATAVGNAVTINVPGGNVGTVTSVAASGGSTGLTFGGSPITSSGTLTLGGTLVVGSGGTGATTAAGARVNLLPSYTGNAGKVLAVNVGATDVEWISLGGTGTVTSVAMTVPTGLTVAGSPITSAGTLAVSLQSGYSIPTTASQTQWDTAYSDRLKWDGGATGLVASTGRTSLGATTVGSNFFTLTNPSAITFPRINADNSVSALDAATFRTAIGAGTGNGTVTSVGGTGTVNGITLTGSVTSTGNLTLGGTLGGIANSQLTNSTITINGTPISLGGSVTVASALTVKDEGTTLTSAASSLNFVGAGVTATAVGNDVTVTISGGGGGGSGTVTSVDVSGGTTGLTTSGGPITTSGTITLAGTLVPANGGTGTSTAFTTGSVVFSGASGVYGQNNSKFFWDNTNYRLGIGTATPPVALSVQAAGATSSLSGYTPLVTSEVVQPTLSRTTAGYGFQTAFAATTSGSATTTPGSNVYATGGYFNAGVSADTNADDTQGSGVIGRAVRATGTGDTGNGGIYLTGVVGLVEQSSTASGAVTDWAIGFSGSIRVTTGTVTSAFGTRNQVYVASGTVTSGYGVYTLGTNSGTLTNYYDAYLAGTNSATNKWGLYQASATHTNFFAGKVGIGTSTPGSSQLAVAGVVESTTGGFKFPNGVTVAAAPTGALVGTTDTQTLTNKRINPRVSSTTSISSPLAWNSDDFDQYAATAQAASLTISADAGTPVDGQKATFRFKDNGAPQTLSWTTGTAKSFRPIGVTLPTTTVANKTVYVGVIYNAADSRWDAVAVAQEA